MPSQFIELIFRVCETKPTPKLQFRFPSQDPNIVDMLVDDRLFAHMVMSQHTGCFDIQTEAYGNFHLDYTESAALILAMVESAKGVNFSEKDLEVFQKVRDGIELEKSNNLKSALLRSISLN